jgi:glycerol uptake facilitator-like aquaporin
MLVETGTFPTTSNVASHQDSYMAIALSLCAAKPNPEKYSFVSKAFSQQGITIFVLFCACSATDSSTPVPTSRNLTAFRIFIFVIFYSFYVRALCGQRINTIPALSGFAGLAPFL